MSDASMMFRPNGATRLLGLIGEHISYTGSPAIHNRAAALLGVNAVYLPFSLPAAKLEAFLDVAWHAGALGFNVTTPHKERVARLLPGSSLSSVNTLYRGADGWVGASTDAAGFVRGLERLGRSLESFDEVVLLGGGGASLALISHFARQSARLTLHVLRRDRERDLVLSTAVAKAEQLVCHDFEPAKLEKLLARKGPATLFIQATNAPQRGDDLRAFVGALDTFSGVLVDLIYAKPSALYLAAQERRIVAQDGEAMLIEQARKAQELWFGRSASYEELAAALQEG